MAPGTPGDQILRETAALGSEVGHTVTNRGPRDLASSVVLIDLRPAFPERPPSAAWVRSETSTG